MLKLYADDATPSYNQCDLVEQFIDCVENEKLTPDEFRAVCGQTRAHVELCRICTVRMDRSEPFLAGLEKWVTPYRPGGANPPRKDIARFS